MGLAREWKQAAELPGRLRDLSGALSQLVGLAKEAERMGRPVYYQEVV